MIASTAFEYVAMDKTGRRQRGVARAATEVDAYRQITAMGLTPIKVAAARERHGGSRRVRQKDIANFTYQLGVMIGARVPVAQGIRNIAEQEPPGQLREALMLVAARIEAGGRIADALQEHPAIFTTLYVETIRAAEHSGNLVNVLEYLSEMLERDVELRSTVRSALMYPICTMCVLVVAVFFLVGFVVPRFTRMYASKKMELPYITQVLIWLGDSVQNYWFLWILGAGAAIVGIRAIWRSRGGRERIEHLLHKVPVLSSLLVGVAVARFARVFGLCLSSGLSLIDSLSMAGAASGRTALQKDVIMIVDQVRNGGRLAGILPGCSYLPGFARRMLTSGEETAELARMCGVVAKHYERDTSIVSKNMATLIEPLLIVVIAGVVLTVAMGIFLPMWDMLKLMG